MRAAVGEMALVRSRLRFGIQMSALAGSLVKGKPIQNTGD